MAKIKVAEQTFEVSKLQDTSYEINGSPFETDLIKIAKDRYHLILNNKSFTIQVLEKDHLRGNLILEVNGRRLQTHHTFKLEELLKSMGLEAGKKIHKDVKAPMPGLVLDVLVKEGQEVTEGEDLIILEAMKMENALKAPHDGVIGSISVQKQAKVDKNQILVSYQ